MHEVKTWIFLGGDSLIWKYLEYMMYNMPSYFHE